MEEFKSFFKTAKAQERSFCKYPTRLDLYGCGCSHDCAYCYAKSQLSFRKLWNPDAPRVADLAKVERVIKRLPRGSIVRLGGMTDCFQPCEQDHRVTLETLKLLNQHGVGCLIVTKSDLIAADEYLAELDPALVHVQISVTNTDDAAALKYEKAAPTSQRLEAFAKLQSSGIDVALRLSPYIRPFIDLGVIASVKPEKVVVEFLRVDCWIRGWLEGIVDLSMYTERHGPNYKHLPLAEKIRQVDEIRAALVGTQVTIAEDVPEHWEYWRENVNPNPDDCCNLRV